MESRVFLEVASTFNCTPLRASLQSALIKEGVADEVGFVQYTQIGEYLLAAAPTSAHRLGTLVILRVEDWLREELHSTPFESLPDGQIRQRLRVQAEEFIRQLATLSDGGEQVWFLTCPSTGWAAEQYKLTTLFHTYTNLISTRVRNLPQVTSLTWPASLSPGQRDDHAGDRLEHTPFTQAAFDRLGDFAGNQIVQTLTRKEAGAASTSGRSAALAGYLAGLNLRVRLARVIPADRTYVDRLLRGTASFSLTGEKHDVADAEIDNLLERHTGLLVTISDRISDYGPAGLLLLRPDEDAMVITSMALSCVVLGKQVEYAILAALAQLASARQLSRLVFEYTPTYRNQAILSFLEAIAERESEARFVLPVGLVGAKVKEVAVNPDAWTVTLLTDPGTDLLAT